MLSWAHVICIVVILAVYSRFGKNTAVLLLASAAAGWFFMAWMNYLWLLDFCLGSSVWILFNGQKPVLRGQTYVYEKPGELQMALILLAHPFPKLCGILWPPLGFSVAMGFTIVLAERIDELYAP